MPLAPPTIGVLAFLLVLWLPAPTASAEGRYLGRGLLGLGVAFDGGCFFSFQAVVDAILAIRKPEEPIDLYMVEIMEMKHKSETDTA